MSNDTTPQHAGKFTDRKLASLKPRAERYEVFEGSGFGLRVTPRGVKSFILLYRHQGRSRRLTLGTYFDPTPNGAKRTKLSEAHTKAATAREALEVGRDPGRELVDERRAERKAETVEELACDYIALYAKAPVGADKRPRKKSWGEDQRILNVYVLPRWGKRKAKDISRADVVSLLDEIAARPAPIQANRTKAVLSKMFRWAIPRGIVNAEPTAMVEKPGKEQKRERALRADEIKKFWHGLDGIEYPAGVRLALKLSLVTAQRRGEVAGIEPTELDDVTALWTIPGARTKNGRPHTVPLSPLALAIIREARQEAAKIENCDPAEIRHLFPAKTIKGTLCSLRPDKLTQALIAEATGILGKPLSPHDLRRTASTLMGSEALGVPRFIRDRLLNHADRTPGSHYDVNEYLAEKRQALVAWGNYVSGLIEQPADNVVAIGGGR